MLFIGDNKILIQYRGIRELVQKGRITIRDKNSVNQIEQFKTVIFETSGLIVPQAEQTRNHIDGKIVAVSELHKDGSVSILQEEGM